MEKKNIPGALLRLLRLERKWSQEQLCSGLCAVSYLSKIEQGKVQPNEELLRSLFLRLDMPWNTMAPEKGRAVCEALYEQVFSDDPVELEKSKEYGILRQEGLAMGRYYVDYLLLRAYCCADRDLIQEGLSELLDSRQLCLLRILEGKPQEAMDIYPCALAVKQAGLKQYQLKDYTGAMTLLQQAYSMAADRGYARIMMECQRIMANCCSQLGDISSMRRHSEVAVRLAKALSAQKEELQIRYNLACTAVEQGYYEEGYDFFSGMEKLSVLDSHKLAICCEKTGRRVEAIAILKPAMESADGIQKKICEIVWYRLKNKYYLEHSEYGNLLMETFHTMQKTMPEGFARFHMPWVEEWCTANRQYKMIYELQKSFRKNG